MSEQTTLSDAFNDRKTRIDAMLARLQALSDAHFGTTPDEADWADVGTLGHIAEQLREIIAFAFGEDEYAE